MNLVGRYDDKREQVEQLRQYLKEQMTIHKILNGFVDVLVTDDVYVGLNSLMQTTGVGGFRPNTVNLLLRSCWMIEDSVLCFR